MDVLRGHAFIESCHWKLGHLFDGESPPYVRSHPMVSGLVEICLEWPVHTPIWRLKRWEVCVGMVSVCMPAFLHTLHTCILIYCMSRIKRTGFFFEHRTLKIKKWQVLICKKFKIHVSRFSSNTLGARCTTIHESCFRIHSRKNIKRRNVITTSIDGTTDGS